jgi:hypothetical protein
MYAQEQFVIHRARITAYQNNQCLKRLLYYKNNVLLQKTKLISLGRSTSHHRHSRAKKTPARIFPHQCTPWLPHLLNGITARVSRPKICCLFQIIDRKGEVANQLELPPQLSNVHDVFHMSQLKNCLWVPEEQISMEQLDLGGDLMYGERPIRILDTAEWVTHSKVIKMCKVRAWSRTQNRIPRAFP